MRILASHPSWKAGVPMALEKLLAALRRSALAGLLAGAITGSFFSAGCSKTPEESAKDLIRNGNYQAAEQLTKKALEELVALNDPSTNDRKEYLIALREITNEKRQIEEHVANNQSWKEMNRSWKEISSNYQRLHEIASFCARQPWYDEIEQLLFDIGFITTPGGFPDNRDNSNPESTVRSYIAAVQAGDNERALTYNLAHDVSHSREVSQSEYLFIIGVKQGQTTTMPSDHPLAQERARSHLGDSYHDGDTLDVAQVRFARKAGASLIEKEFTLIKHRNRPWVIIY